MQIRAIIEDIGHLPTMSAPNCVGSLSAVLLGPR